MTTLRSVERCFPLRGTCAWVYVCFLFLIFACSLFAVSPLNPPQGDLSVGLCLFSVFNSAYSLFSVFYFSFLFPRLHQFQTAKSPWGGFRGLGFEYQVQRYENYFNVRFFCGVNWWNGSCPYIYPKNGFLHGWGVLKCVKGGCFVIFTERISI